VEIHFKAKYSELNEAFIGIILSSGSIFRNISHWLEKIIGRGYYTRLHYNCMVQVEPLSNLNRAGFGINWSEPDLIFHP
jgi:hypothetical protein